jgi:hypothetical protein
MLDGIHGWTELTCPHSSHTPWHPEWGVWAAEGVSAAPPLSTVATRSTGLLCFLLNASLFLDLNDQLLCGNGQAPSGLPRKSGVSPGPGVPAQTHYPSSGHCRRGQPSSGYSAEATDFPTMWPGLCRKSWPSVCPCLSPW